MSTGNWLLSVDFGTSNTAAAHSAAVSGATETLPLSHTSNVMPSGVFVAGPDRIAVGDHALDEAQRFPAGFLPAPKRLVGQGSVSVNGVDLPTWQPVAAIFRTVFSRAAAVHAGQMPERLVLTHPEAWSPAQVDVLRQAAAAAGMDPAATVTVSEPRAAAAHYARGNRVPPGGRIAVFDFGGGTLDVAVLGTDTDGGFEVVAARGDNALGGKTLDATVRSWVIEQLDARDPDLSTALRSPVARRALDESIRRAKEFLSEAPSATISVSGDGVAETLQITRDEFEELIADPVAAAVRLARAVFDDAGVSAENPLSAIFLTGGTSRVPLVQRALQDLGPVATLDDPKTVVARGAIAAVTTAGRQPSMPAAGDLLTRWDTAPTPAARADDQPQRRGRRPLIAAGVAAVLVVAAVVTAVVLTRGGSDENPSAGGASPSAAASSSVASATTAEQVQAALPDRLRGSLRGCTQSSAMVGSPFAITCSIDSSSGLVTGLLDSRARIILAVDDGNARRDVVRIRQGAGASADDVLVENTARTAAATISQDPGSSATIMYAGSANGIRMFLTGVLGATEGKTFLTRSELIQ
ncbi:Hsp70 family protein [Williamsia deligens]|uniref:Hsp70 family protein n=1 Tax=Williamsia deligens TaxID=321325 RepID=A0ABW3GA70_9NOCA|nr:Hsp70 family protein [Williamsia deligens]MCP2193427.1 Hsp70 protein [Williamsia deligens]